MAGIPVVGDHLSSRKIQLLFQLYSWYSIYSLE